MMELYYKREQLYKEMEYPARYRPENLLKTAGILCGVLFIFLMLYKPFGVYAPELKFNYIIICALHAISPALIVYIYFSLLDVARANGRYLQQWTLAREYAQLAIVFLLIGIGSFLLRSFIYNNPDNWSIRYFWEEIRNCFLVGSLFYFFLLFASFYFKAANTTSNEVIVDPIGPEHTITKTADRVLFIQTHVKQDDFSFNPHHLLFVKAKGNYIELTVCTHGCITTELKRISLLQFESQLAEYPFVFRCHRAYLVNIMHIEKVSGNSQGYLVSFQFPTENIPVSRSRLDEFDNFYDRFRGVNSC